MNTEEKGSTRSDTSQVYHKMDLEDHSTIGDSHQEEKSVEQHHHHHHHHHHPVQSGILLHQTGVDQLEYPYSIAPANSGHIRSTSPAERPSLGFVQQGRNTTGSPKSNKSKVSFSGSMENIQRPTSAPVLAKVGAPTDFQTVEGKQELTSRLYTSDNTKPQKKRSWR